MNVETDKLIFIYERKVDYMKEKLYAIAICNGASDCIPDAEHIERVDELVERLGKLDEIDDFVAAQMAKADGIKLIDDIEGIYKDFYVDTEENRRIIYKYMEEHPDEVGKELMGIWR